MTHPIDDYLAGVERRLPGSRRMRAEVVAELRDGLLTAVEERGEDELPRILDEFGSPARVAAGFGPELRLGLVRRGAAQILAVLFATGVAWRCFETVWGTPDSTIPTGWTRPVFLAATGVIEIAPVVAQLAALACLGVVLIAGPGRLLHAAAVVTSVGVVGFGLGALAICVTVAAPHRLETIGLGIPLALLTVGLARRAHRLAADARAARG
ncbi:hypothetical protein LX16_3209 [Stackebrandtia albiflava]|uniref:Uncharacterized protein n=1 Tax=Stackebrandtia albiflava TaxID=406432 RepID=A0A562V3I9_9ACTN|nr:hypothetical protein [Stackebrandtia albiflava]TWJ12451.1 hypothetical protein LX16_3209 [Stackebrandtia albiflava]